MDQEDWDDYIQLDEMKDYGSWIKTDLYNIIGTIREIKLAKLSQYQDQPKKEVRLWNLN
jgi:hypothetical protein